jgi:hypothetical protein
MRMLKVVFAATALLLAGWIAYIIAFNSIPPSATITVNRDSNGACRFHIRPNFVVNSVYRVAVVTTTGVVAERKKPVSGAQDFVVDADLASGTQVTVHYDLQYDRGWAACITTQTASFVVPYPAER